MNRKQSEEDYDELLEDGDEDLGRKNEPEEYPKRVSRNDDDELEEQQVIKKAVSRPNIPQPKQSTTKKASKRFAPFAQPERIGVAFSDTGEVLADGMPEWFARAYADLKNDIDELKDIIGRM